MADSEQGQATPQRGWRRRRPWAAAALLVAAALSLAVALVPAINRDPAGAAVLGLLLAALWLRRGAPWRRPGRGALLLVPALLALAPFTFIAQVFGRADMLAVLFHLNFGTSGVTLAGLFDEALAAALSLGLFLLSVIWLFGLLRAPMAAWVALALALVAVNPLVHYGAGQVARHAGAGGPSLVPIRAALAPPAAPLPDLVLIYLEGTELGYENAAAFGDAFAPLAELAAEAISFRGIGQAEGTGWSMAGMVASQCGVPLLPNGLRYRNNFAEQEDFLGALDCLGDVLKARGYRSEMLLGSAAEFAGLDHFYRSHGIESVIDLEAIRARTPPAVFEAALVGWSIDDQLLFEVARARHAALTAAPGPVALIVETIGPHGPEGFLSRRCTASGRAELSRDLAATVRCTAREARDFVRFLQAAERDRPLKIVLLSDHLAHHQSRGLADPARPRRNTVLFLDPDRAGEVIAAPGAMFDVYPTLLQWLGFAAPPHLAGLGVSLLADTPTLTAALGAEALDQRLLDDLALAALLWRPSR